MQGIFEALGQRCCDLGNSGYGMASLLSTVGEFRFSLLTAFLPPDLNRFGHPLPEVLDAGFMTRVGRHEFGWNPA